MRLRLQVHSTSVHICGVVVEYQTPTGRVNKGVATTWLQTKIPAGEGEEMVCPKVPVYIRRSQFKLPNRPQTPVIMIGPGTGLAPFRGFIQVGNALESQVFCFNQTTNFNILSTNVSWLVISLSISDIILVDK